MLPQDNAIRMYFAKLGLEPEIADLYLSLHTNGAQSISELSRSSKVERTRIYRLIVKLMESNLIELESGHKRGIIKAAPIANVKILISQKEQELQSLRDDLELVETTLARNSLSSPAVKVQFYHGPEGLRQMQWNQTRAKLELLVIQHEPINATLGDAFTLAWADKINSNEQKVRMLHNARFKKLNEEWYKSKNIPELIKNIEAKLLNNEDFEITHNTVIYDDIIAYVIWKDDEIFGIETHNKYIADSQRQVFEILWNSTL